jgi:hypothetical protein
MRKIFFAIGLSIGSLLVGMSIFAEQIGLDNNSGWGAGRYLMLEAGIAMLIISILGMAFRNKLTVLGQRISGVVNKFNQIDYSARMIIFSLPVILVVIASYFWFALPNFESSKFNYYSLQATAFKKHQLYLVQEPSPALLALDDPYNYALRKSRGVEDFPWDASLYNKKFYLYWGPVPSLPLVLFSAEQLNHIGDEALVLAFMCGLFFYCVLFSHSIWLRFNQALPAWLFSVAVLIIGLSAPATWMLNASRVYEAAIIGCQFFFIGGCYWAYNSLKDKSPSPLKLILAGLHWALALGTRFTISPVIFFATGMTLLYVFRQTKPFSPKSFLPALAFLCTPLALAAIGLGWYNWARFNSVFEFGLTYQLATVNYTTFHTPFSTYYINDNLYNYFVHALKFQRQFPYIQPIENIFSNERLAGLLYISPYFLFAGLFIGRGIRRENLINEEDKGSLGNWLMLTLAGSSLISTLTILSYYFPATRFGEDFMPSLLLLATASLGQGYRFLGGNIITRKAYIFFITLVALFSVIASSLVAFLPQRAKFIFAFIQGIYRFFGFR